VAPHGAKRSAANTLAQPAVSAPSAPGENHLFSIETTPCGGPSFAVAKALNAAKVPFVFLTGYDQAVITEAFSTVQRVQKPLEPQEIVCPLAQLLKPRG